MGSGFSAITNIKSGLANTKVDDDLNLIGSIKFCVL